MRSAKFTLADSDWNECITCPGVYKINDKKYTLTLYSEKSYDRKYASICIGKVMYNYRYSGPKACLSIYEPKYIRYSRYDSYLFTKTDIDNLILLFKSNYRSDMAIIKFGSGDIHRFESDYEGDNTLWDYVMWTMSVECGTPRYLNMPDYTELKMAENDVMNYDHIKYQNDTDIEINHKYIGRNDDIYKIPQFLIF